MIKMTLAEAATLIGATPPSGETLFQGISIDSRTLRPGNLFIAIIGERLDGHQYVEEAYKKGAVAVIVDRELDSPMPQLIVADTTLALGKLGAEWRKNFDIPFIAITGSNGKTTLKNMIASILVAACGNEKTKVLATPGTLNNQWGLPLTLVDLNAQHRFAVIEMGMNHFGEIEYLSKLTRPDVAVINNAASAHLDGVGDLAGVARAKAEIFSGLVSDGIAILNRDDAFFDYWRESIGEHDYLSFGFNPEADISTTISSVDQTQQLKIATPRGIVDIQLPLLGKHNALNATAAVAATFIVGIDLSAIKAGLEKMDTAPGRLQVHTLENGVKIIDDSYNANPFSLQAAVNTLASFAGKKILVLGDMKELGTEAKSLHQTAGQSIRQAGIDYLFTFGDLSANAAQTFGEGAYHFNEQEKLLNALKPFLYNQTTILIKGSRSMKMEKVVSGLMST